MTTIKYSESQGNNSPDIWGIYESATGSIQYICADPDTKQAALIDIVQDYDPASARTGFESADKVLDLVKREELEIVHILDTHPHADHLMASSYLREKTGAPNAIGEKTREIADLWEEIYSIPDAFDPEADFDRLLAEGDTFKIGDLDVEVWLSPGHTLGSVTYLVGDSAFVHDTLMFPDTGTSRSDFPGGSTTELWNSIQRILSLPDETRLFVGHDYCSDERDEPMWEATVAEHKSGNVHLADTSMEEFLSLRRERDKTLSLPDRMLAALQVNLRAGKLPSGDKPSLTIPLNRFKGDGA
ncbi:MBL fold metallo-hydrolase [Granulosicoccus sp. 3-233]|uniref:MBL fold metallo-hydrolase n=1 Tax=Granulosicoccus sp. 3-233 TaxID=3417969 RepID=UPI003D32DA6D